MNKESFIKIINGADKEVKNIVISTDVKTNLGLNGTDYGKFNTHKIKQENNYGTTYKEETFTTIIFNEDYAVFDVKIVKTHFYRKGDAEEFDGEKKFRYFVPYENIVQVSYHY